MISYQCKEIDKNIFEERKFDLFVFVDKKETKVKQPENKELKKEIASKEDKKEEGVIDKNNLNGNVLFGQKENPPVVEKEKLFGSGLNNNKEGGFNLFLNIGNTKIPTLQIIVPTLQENNKLFPQNDNKQNNDRNILPEKNIIQDKNILPEKIIIPDKNIIPQQNKIFTNKDIIPDLKSQNNINISDKNILPLQNNITEKNKIPQQTVTPQQNTIPEKDVISPPLATNTYTVKLLSAANNYWTKRNTRIEFTNNKTYKKQIDKIMTEIINPTIDQISSEGDLPDKVKKITSLLKELYDNKFYELYDFSLNLICQKIVSKSENYLKDRKTLLLFAKFIFSIRKTFKLIEDFFFMILAYKCPYIIPKVYNKNDFPDKETYMKRLGYSNSEEPITTWMANMECYSYLFFAYLGLDENSMPLIREYVANLESLPVDYPLSTVFKAFLNTLGAKFKTKFSEGAALLKKLVAKYVKELEELKTKSKSSELKSITADNIHFIKKYFQSSDFKFN